MLSGQRALVYVILTTRVLKFVRHDGDDDIIPGYDLCSQSDSGSVVNQYQLLLLHGGSGSGHPNIHKSGFGVRGEVTRVVYVYVYVYVYKGTQIESYALAD